MCRWTRTRPQPSEWHHRPIKIARGSDGRHAKGEKNTRHLTFPISPAVATRSDDRVRSRQMPKLRAATLFHRRARKRGGAGNQEARHKNAQPRPPHVKLCAVFSVGKSRFRSRFLFLEQRSSSVGRAQPHRCALPPPGQAPGCSQPRVWVACGCHCLTRASLPQQRCGGPPRC